MYASEGSFELRQLVFTFYLYRGRLNKRPRRLEARSSLSVPIVWEYMGKVLVCIYMYIYVAVVTAGSIIMFAYTCTPH